MSHHAPDPSDVRQDDDHLHAGEERLEEATVGDARLVLTNHRLLVSREHGEPHFRAVDRPNVLGVSVATTGPRWAPAFAVQAALLAVAGVGGGLLLPDRFLDPPSVAPPPALGLEGLFETATTVLGLVALLDEALLGLGLVALLATVALLAWYLLGRERHVEIAVSGADPVELASADPAADRERVVGLLDER